MKKTIAFLLFTILVNANSNDLVYVDKNGDVVNQYNKYSTDRYNQNPYSKSYDDMYTPKLPEPDTRYGGGDHDGDGTLDLYDYSPNDSSED